MADPLSILGAVETSLNFTVLIYNQVKSFINYKHDAVDLAIRFKDDKQLLTVFLAFFQDNKHHLDQEQIEYFVDLTGHLNEMLGSTASDLQKYRPDATFRRVSWGWVKSSLEEAERALRDWVSRLQSRFNMLPKDIREDLYVRMMNPTYEAKPVRALLNHISMKKAKMDSIDAQDRFKLAEQPENEPEEDEEENKKKGPARLEFWKDIITVPDGWEKPQNEDLLKGLRADIARLAVVLKGSDVNVTHIPAASCWYEAKDGDKVDWFGIAYKIPPKVMRAETRTLKEAIKDPLGRLHPLNERLRIAVEIVSAVSYLHELEYVHKYIRSDHVKLTFERQDNVSFKGGYLGHANLTGFSFARKGTGDEYSRNFKGTFDWKIQLYCHPKRQIIEEKKEPRDKTDAGAKQAPFDIEEQDEPKFEYFKYKHDVYSVGVVLLEVGLWQDLEKYRNGLQPADPDVRKKTLCDLAYGELARCMGKRYAGIASRCLDVDHQGEKFRVQDVLKELGDIHL